MPKSCLQCSNFVQCRDNRKGSKGYSCTNFKVLKRLSLAQLSEDQVLTGDDLIPKEAKEQEENEPKQKIPSNYDVDDFDVVSLIESSFDSDTNTVRDLTVDDRDLPKAKNYYDFCTNFLGKNTKIPFARQMWIGYHLHGEYCPRCSNPKWENIQEVPVDYPTKEMPEHIAFLENGICPRCKVTRSELFKSEELNLYTELDACVGQRGGKSVWTASDSAYVTHCYLKLPQLSTIAPGIQSFSPLTATFVAVRFADAYSLLWTPIMRMIDDSPWFVDYHKLLTTTSEKYGKELLQKRDVFVRYRHKNLELLPAGPNKRGLRGRTRFIGAIDELGWFPLRDKGKNDSDEEASDTGDRERADAEEVYIALENSMGTVNTEVSKLILNEGMNTLMPAYMICVSSPSSRQDKIWRLVQTNKNSRTALAIHLPTWEMNPNMPRDCAFITKRYQVDPIKAERDLGANPPKSASQFIENLEAIKRCFIGKNRVAWQYEERFLDGKNYRAATLTRIDPPPLLYPAVAAIDAGYSNNSFALVVGHLEEHCVRTDCLIEIQPGDGAVLHYNRIYKEIISKVIDALNVKFLFADRWQSIAILHRAQEEKGITAEMYSVKIDDFNLTKSKLESTEIILPKMEKEFTDDDAVTGYPGNFREHTPEHLFHQIGTVVEVGKTIMKGPGYTDDIFRALTLMIGRTYHPKILEQLKEMKPMQRQSKVIGAIVTHSNSSPRTVGRTSIGSVGSRRF
jgi:hypothetical protein